LRAPLTRPRAREHTCTTPVRGHKERRHQTQPITADHAQLLGMASSLANATLQWVRPYVDHNTDIDTSHGSLKKCFANAKAFLAILNCIDPLFVYQPSDNPVQNMKVAFKAFEDSYGVPDLLDAEPYALSDLKTLVLYLSGQLGIGRQRVVYGKSMS